MGSQQTVRLRFCFLYPRGGGDGGAPLGWSYWFSALSGGALGCGQGGIAVQAAKVELELEVELEEVPVPLRMPTALLSRALPAPLRNETISLTVQ